MTSSRTWLWVAAGAVVATAGLVAGLPAIGAKPRPESRGFDLRIERNSAALAREGRTTFRYETFGDEAFWGGQLRLHESLRAVKPSDALALGLKIDVDALSHATRNAIRRRKVDLGDPAVTRDLLRRNAVVGLKGIFDRAGQLTSVGITCALCHSTVDDSLAPGIGHRLDGWANRDLDVGQIVNLAPSVAPIATVLGVDEATVRTVLTSWGPGRYDASLLLDGKAFRPDGKTGATLIPPAFGLAGVNLHTWTGWGSVTYWNAFVAVIQMHGKGNFSDPRLKDPVQFPVAARNGFDNVVSEPDLVTPRLAALHAYQLGIPAPKPRAGSFNAAAAARGDVLFEHKANCARCHTDPLTTEPGWNLHTPAEMGIDAFQADRAPDHRYRTSPLRGLWTHTKGGFFHDGRFATLRDVIVHYDALFTLGLTAPEMSDLEEYLKSL